jgi:hypothetical protein
MVLYRIASSMIVVALWDRIKIRHVDYRSQRPLGFTLPVVVITEVIDVFLRWEAVILSGMLLLRLGWHLW